MVPGIIESPATHRNSYNSVGYLLLTRQEWRHLYLGHKYLSLAKTLKIKAQNYVCSVSLSVSGHTAGYTTNLMLFLLQPKIMLPPYHLQKLLLFVFGGLNRLHLGPSFAKFRHTIT